MESATDMTWLARVCAFHEDNARVAVIDPTGPVTGRQLIGKAACATELLVGLDTPAGQPIPALVTTNADALATLLGGAAANRPIAPLGPRQTVAELATVLRRNGSSALLAETPFVEIARQAAEEVGIRVVTVPDLAVSGGGLQCAPGPTAIYLHTAGTTGIPKRVPLTDQVLDARTGVLRELTGLGPDDRYATGSPLHHIGGLGNILVALSTGAAVICTSRFTFDWWRNLPQHNATHCLLVPTMIEMLLSEGLLDVVPLKVLIYGASPMSVTTLRRVLEVLPDVALINLYGQTEGSPITCLGPDDHRRALVENPDLLGTVGRPVSCLQLRIHEPDHAGVGEVLAAAEHLCARDADGWLHTGDLGVVDDNGYVRLCGRRQDMIIRGGENIYPLEVENVLVTHPAVAAAGVVGVPDQRLGEIVAAFVVPMDPECSPHADELRLFARSVLAGYKVPQYIYFVPELPLNSAGKVVRTMLRAAHLDRGF
jgi:acyl-CoA synthetase (AMP-forming)/AMP-acid ligase II